MAKTGEDTAQIYDFDLPTDGPSNQRIIGIDYKGKRTGLVSCPRENDYWLLKTKHMPTLDENIQENNVRPQEVEGEVVEALLEEMQSIRDVGCDSSGQLAEKVNAVLDLLQAQTQKGEK